jgi:hypothetical protein
MAINHNGFSKGDCMSDVIRADQVKPESVDWLWRERIPRQMITEFAGRPGKGKSTLAALIAADVTRKGGNVLWCAREDSAAIMTAPRLIAAGANMKQVWITGVTLPSGIIELEEKIIDHKIDLIVIDPVAAHLDSGISRFNDNVRRMTNPLTKIIERHNCACIVIDHTKKSVKLTEEPLNAIGGSGSGLPAACKMAFLVGHDQDDEDRVIMAAAKHSVCMKPKALAFERDAVDVEGVRDPVPSLVYQHETIYDAIRLVSGKVEADKRSIPQDKRAAAAEWLTKYLMAAGKAVHAGKIKEDGLQFGITNRTLRRAAQDVEIVKNPLGGGPNCKWDLPDETRAALAEDDDDAIEAIGEELADKLPEDDTDTTIDPGDITDDMINKWLADGSDGPLAGGGS